MNFELNRRKRGLDFSGTVVWAPASSGLTQGDSIFGVAPLGIGTFAQEIHVHLHQIAHKSQSLSLNEAAAL